MLYIDNGNGGVIYTQAYKGSTLTSTIIYNLTPGVTYMFKIAAINFNGEGTASTTTSLISCIAP